MNLIKTAVDAALEAGSAILEIYEQDFEVEFKADESPLTSADKASHEIIEKALSETGIPVLSEESKEIPYEDRRGWSEYWLVDPIDGTKEFIKKNGEFTVNIALVRDGVPKMGVVYVPVKETLYLGAAFAEGEVEAGAWKAEDCAGKNGAEILPKMSSISVSGTPQDRLKVVASKSHCTDETLTFISGLEEKYGPADRVSRGSSLKLCMVAEGSADIYPRIAPTMEWDTGAAHAVVTAAGGMVYSFCEDTPAGEYVVDNSSLVELPYNKENLLNTYFVVSGLHK